MGIQIGTADIVKDLESSMLGDYLEIMLKGAYGADWLGKVTQKCIDKVENDPQHGGYYRTAVINMRHENIPITKESFDVSALNQLLLFDFRKDCCLYSETATEIKGIVESRNGLSHTAGLKPTDYKLRCIQALEKMESFCRSLELHGWASGSNPAKKAFLSRYRNEIQKIKRDISGSPAADNSATDSRGAGSPAGSGYTPGSRTTGSRGAGSYAGSGRTAGNRGAGRGSYAGNSRATGSRASSSGSHAGNSHAAGTHAAGSHASGRGLPIGKIAGVLGAAVVVGGVIFFGRDLLGSEKRNTQTGTQVQTTTQTQTAAQTQADTQTQTAAQTQADTQAQTAAQTQTETQAQAAAQQASASSADAYYNQTGSLTWNDMEFTVERTGKTSATLTAVSYSAGKWKFGPWVTSDSPVKAVRKDGTAAYAYINIGEFSREYGGTNFTEGKTMVINLSFDADADGEWDHVELELASLQGQDEKVPVPMEAAAAAAQTQTTEASQTAETVSLSGQLYGFEVTLISSDANSIRLQYTNGDTNMCLGWVDPCDVTIMTDQGTYYAKLNTEKEISRGETGQISVSVNSGMEGTIQSIILEDVNALENGLPIHTAGGERLILS